jgi:hypothetical protein
MLNECVVLASSSIRIDRSFMFELEVQTRFNEPEKATGEKAA